MEKQDCNEIIADGMTVVVKNVMGAFELGEPAKADKRLSYWEKSTGQKAGKCAHEICCRPATSEAVATIAFSSDKRKYVYPACETCARRTEMLYVKGPLAPLD